MSAPISDQDNAPGPSRPAPEASKKLRFESTPVRHKLGANTAIPNPVEMGLSQARDQLAADMQGRWLGPMPIQEFFNSFLPPAADSPPAYPTHVLRDVGTEPLESQRYDRLVST